MAYEEQALTICTNLLTAVTKAGNSDSDSELHKDMDGQTCTLYGKRVVKSVVALLLNLLQGGGNIKDKWREGGGVDLILQVLKQYRHDQDIAVICVCTCMHSCMYVCMYGIA
jgi:hypothetical protein